MLFFTILFLLLFGHAVADFPLQGDFLSKAKNRYAPIPGVPWPIAMASHGLIHAGMVYLVTGSLALAWAEWCFHISIDELKCRGKIDFNTDQALHVACKVAWAIIVAAGLLP